jgi:hypothetical protein
MRFPEIVAQQFDTNIFRRKVVTTTAVSCIRIAASSKRVSRGKLGVTSQALQNSTY